MPQKRIRFNNFSRKLVLAGGREQTGPGGMRRTMGVAPEQAPSVTSRWGSPLLFGGINAIQLYYWNGARFAYDGANLYRNGAILMSGFNGSKLSFNSMPPAAGVDDYLFILGGGKTPFKMDSSFRVTQWGINAPLDGMQTKVAAQDQIIIDTFNGSSANWTPSNCMVANESSVVFTGGGSLKVTPSAGPWSITNTLIATLNLGVYPDAVVSLLSDIISIWVNVKVPTTTIWLWVMFDVDDGTFKNNYYKNVIQLIPTTANKHAADANIIVTAPADAWVQLQLPKSNWQRFGTKKNLDWSLVQAIRIQGGYLPPSGGGSGVVYLDLFTQFGGYPLGEGPAAVSGGSTYSYVVTYGNDVTGNDSNPNDTPIVVSGVALQPIQLFNIPTSLDPQVTNRKLWRTQANGAEFFYLDRIPDNVTTGYTDVTGDIFQQIITTPWEPSVTIIANSYVDMGNGYYGYTVAGGTTGTTPPTWNIPTTSWTSLTKIDVSGETIFPTKTPANSAFMANNPGTTGKVEPNWFLAPAVGNTIVDGNVVWQNVGPLNTGDGLVLWICRGLNAVPILGNNAVLFDNAPPNLTVTDAYGPYLDSMFWTRDTAVGAAGFIYASPPGRPESFAQAYHVSSTNDPMQKLQEYDGVLWALSEQFAFYAQGSYPGFTFPTVMGADGTTQPYTVVRVPGLGILYWCHDGVRILSWGTSRLVSFAEIAPILRGQGTENIQQPFSYLNPPTWAARIKDEIIVGNNGTLAIAISYDGLMGGELIWRQLPTLTAAYYDLQTGEVQASLLGNIIQFENPGALTDAGVPVQFEIQTPGDFPDPGAQFTTQRIYISANLNLSQVPQIVIPTLIIDGVERVLPALPAKSGRTTYELAPKMCGRLFDAIRLTGATQLGGLTGRVEVYDCSADVWLGEQEAG